MNLKSRKLTILLFAIVPAACLAIILWPKAYLTISPAVVSDCKNPQGRPKINVQWDASDLDVKYVRFTVNRPGQEKKGWTRGKPKGSKKTGPWGTDGLTFTMYDHKGRELARRTLESTPCDGRG